MHYLDITVDKVSNTANRMSSLKILFNNRVVLDEPDLFNNVGSNLQFAFAGTFKTDPEPDLQGYLNTTSVDDEIEASLGYSITNLYVTRNGLRFGKPRITSAPLLATSEDPPLVPNNFDETPVVDILNSGPQDWTFLYSNKPDPITLTFEAVPNTSPYPQITQITANGQSQGGTTSTAEFGVSGSDPVDHPLPSVQKAVYVHLDEDQDTVQLTLR
jgi:hypothetical protein